MTSVPKLLDRVRDAIRARHYSRRTKEAYVCWIRRYIMFHDKAHPSTMGAREISAFLTWLATRQRVSASTQNQGLSALLFLYCVVLRVDVNPLAHIPRARAPDRLPVVLGRDRSAVLAHLAGTMKLIGLLLHGAGLAPARVPRASGEGHLTSIGARSSFGGARGRGIE